MFHLALNQFPHNVSRFNLGDDELRALVDAWVREQWIELGERKWNPHQAQMTILQGPELAMQQMSMGRGWRTAERQSQDVTERVLAAAREAMQQAAASAQASAAEPGAPAPGDPLALGVQMATLLGSDPARLLEAWRTLAESSPELAPSEALAAAERALANPD